MLQEAEAPIKQLPREHGIPIIGSAHEFMSANGIPIDFLSRVQQQHGDVAQFKVINRTMILVSDPDLVHEILVKRVHEFPKPSAVVQKPRGIMRFLGKGILTAGYAEWKPQRQLMQPFMHRKHIESYAQTMANLTETLLLQWQDGAERNIHSDMTQLTMWIIADTMFGLGMNQLTDFEDLVTRAQKIIINDFVGILPNWLTGQSTAAADVNAQMTEFVRQMIADYDGSERNDLLSLLLNYRDEDGKPLSDEFLRDNILTMFFAGHETTANTLTWAFYYLSQNPDVLGTLQAEVDTVLADGHAPQLDDLTRLPYTLRVIKETLRIQPTVSAIPRLTIAPTHLGDYQLPQYALVLMSPRILHHDERYWKRPYEFMPERFSSENEATLCKHSYLPFGGGPRVCIGNHFALMEAQIILAHVIRHYQLHLLAEREVEPLYQVTTHPKDGLFMRLECRS